MLPKLTPLQSRVIGVLLEKEITTPDQYPLSLNGLTTGCNQKSNREPVLNLSEFDVQDVIDELLALKLMSDDGAMGGRVVKYKHRFCNTEFGSFKLTSQQLAIVCVLLLRGPQTPGELRTRTNRLAEFANVAEVEAVLEQLQCLNGEAVVARLEREPGKRESRYVHLLSDEGSDVELDDDPVDEMTVPKDSESRISELEKQVARLTTQLHDLEEKMKLILD